MDAQTARLEREPGVSTLELFFDLVFVFALTQLTGVLAGRFDERGLLQVAVMLGLIWWMYGGYVWLTNAVAPDRAGRRFPLLGGMGAYLVLALAIPEAFGGSGLTFGLAYAAVILVHSGLFSHAAEGRFVVIAPYNLLVAAVVVVGGGLGGTAQYVLWALAALFAWVTPHLIDSSSLQIAPSHFVERHGLVVIIAIGESIVALGIGAQGLAVDLPLVLVVNLGLGLSACLWWAYFRGDDERAERSLAATPTERRPQLAIEAFGYAHYLILLGIIGIASALKTATGHAFDAFTLEQALGLAGGLFLFLLGDALFRRSLAIGRIDIRLVAAVLALATVPLGTELTAFAQLVVLVLLTVTALYAESRATPPP